MTLVFMFWLYQRDLSSTVEPSTANNFAVRVETPAATAALNPTSSAAVVPSTASGASANVSSTARTTSSTSSSLSPAELQSQIADSRLNLEQLSNSLAGLRQIQNQRELQLQNDYPYQIQLTSSTIRGLSQAQQDLRASEASVYMQSRADLQEQMALSRLARDTLEPAIRSLESQHEVTMDEMRTLQEISLRSVSQESRLAELQALTAQQQAQLAQLREQKNTISTAAFEQFQLLSGTYRQLQNEIRAEQAAVQSELNLRRSQIDELEQAQTQMRMSLMPLEQRILQTENAVSIQRRRLQELERQLSRNEAGSAPPDATSATTPTSETR